MLRIRLNELGKGNDNGLIQADVWKWDGIGWNEYITQQDEDFIRTEEELFVTIPAEAGLYRVDYSNKPFEAPYLLPEWVGTICGPRVCIPRRLISKRAHFGDILTTKAVFRLNLGTNMLRIFRRTVLP